MPYLKGITEETYKEEQLKKEGRARKEEDISKGPANPKWKSNEIKIMKYYNGTKCQLYYANRSERIYCKESQKGCLDRKDRNSYWQIKDLGVQEEMSTPNHVK